MERLRREEERQNLNDLRDLIPPLVKPTKKNIINGAINFIKKLELDGKRLTDEENILTAENRRLELEKGKKLAEILGRMHDDGQIWLFLSDLVNQIQDFIYLNTENDVISLCKYFYCIIDCK